MKVPAEVQLDQSQLLTQVLPIRTPVVPEAVQLGHGVLNHHLALNMMGPLPVPDNQTTDGGSRPRRSTRLEIDYKKYNQTGKTN